jgi:hypothetical protein
MVRSLMALVLRRGLAGGAEGKFRQSEQMEFLTGKTGRDS